MATTATELMTAEELALLPEDGWRYELVRGELRRMSPSSLRPGVISARLTIRIGNYVEAHGLGELTTAEAGYVLERGPDTVRAPDVAFVRAERMPPLDEQYRFAELVPDLAVEVISPSDRPKDVEAKVEQYLATGVPLVWVFDPKGRTATVRRAGRAPQVLGIGGELDGEEILPGFRLPLADVYR